MGERDIGLGYSHGLALDSLDTLEWSARSPKGLSCSARKLFLAFAYRAKRIVHFGHSAPSALILLMCTLGGFLLGLLTP
jgi:hypothetical protein